MKQDHWESFYRLLLVGPRSGIDDYQKNLPTETLHLFGISLKTYRCIHAAGASMPLPNSLVGTSTHHPSVPSVPSQRTRIATSSIDHQPTLRLRDWTRLLSRKLALLGISGISTASVVLLHLVHGIRETMQALLLTYRDFRAPALSGRSTSDVSMSFAFSSCMWGIGIRLRCPACHRPCTFPFMGAEHVAQNYLGITHPKVFNLQLSIMIDALKEAFGENKYFLGVAFLLAASFLFVTPLLVADIHYDWNSPLVMTLLTFSGSLWIAFLAWERRVTAVSNVSKPVFPWIFRYAEILPASKTVYSPRISRFQASNFTK